LIATTATTETKTTQNINFSVDERRKAKQLAVEELIRRCKKSVALCWHFEMLFENFPVR